MEKPSIFCNGCPVQTHCSSADSDRPVAFGGESSPVSATTARHHLGSTDPAARFRMVNQSGEIIEDQAATVVAPAGLTNDEVSAYFETCTQPNDNEFTVGTKRFNISFKLGKSCAALTSIELGAEHASSRQTSQS